MAKIFLALSFLSFLSLEPTVAQIRKTDRDYDGFVGTVKTVRVETAKLSTKAGMLVEEKPTLERTIEYKKQGERIQEVLYTDKEDILYPTNSACYPRQHDYTRIDYRYDAHGNRTETLAIKNLHGDIKSRMRSWVFQDDSVGNRISESVYLDRLNRDADIDSDCVFAPQVGRLPIGVYTHSYDDKGQRIATIYSEGGRPLYRWTYKRDESGNVSEMSKYSGDRLIMRQAYQYEFDPKGNWVKRKTSKWVTMNGQSTYEPIEATHRTLTYY
jgi:hypothetical protein